MIFKEEKVIEKSEEMVQELRVNIINDALVKIVNDNEKTFATINEKLDKLLNANEPKSYELSLNHDELSYLIKLLETELAFNKNNTDTHTTYLEQKLKEVFYNEK